MAIATTDVLAAALVEFFETNQGEDKVFAPDLFVDMNVPEWRFQIEGRDGLAQSLRSDCPQGQRIRSSRTIQTADGFVLEIESRYPNHHGTQVYCRFVNIATVRDGLVSDLVVYCTGEWDADTEARQKAEAPMFRS